MWAASKNQSNDLWRGVRDSLLMIFLYSLTPSASAMGLTVSLSSIAISNLCNANSSALKKIIALQFVGAQCVDLTCLCILTTRGSVLKH